ncbi:hypothetical protein FOL47_003969, partial [Perkinsus chesapeaki]
RGRSDTLYVHFKKFQLLAEDYETIEDLCEALGYFLDATKLLSGTRFPTLGLIRPVVKGLLATLDDTSDGRGRRSKIRQCLSESLEKYFKEHLDDDSSIGILCTCATYLNPNFADTETETVGQAAVRSCMEGLGIEDRVSMLRGERISQAANNESSECTLLSKLRRREPCIRPEDASSLTRELQMYERMLVNREEGSRVAVMEFWEEVTELPILAEVAREILSIPSGSVA